MKIINKIIDFMYGVKLIIKDMCDEVKYAYQRVFRGYDDLTRWNLETDVAIMVKSITYDMSQNCNSYPDGLTLKQWKKILGQISFGFGSYIEMRSGFYDYKDKEYKRLEKEYNNGMKLFIKWYGDLWD